MPKLAAVFVALAALAGLVRLSPAERAEPAADAPRTVTCSFSHPAYSGWCKQSKAIPKDGTSDQVCQDILRCLNDTQCSDTYCNATELRGGWKLEAVDVMDSGKKSP
ncbi:MAG TPA: hypothetical protein VIB08_02805 [Thermoanaerobaculia bacterium]|jgi:hypothetical protein